MKVTLILFFSLILSMFYDVSQADDLVVKVKQGLLKGIEEKATPFANRPIKYYSFKGIPYAQPPTGEYRFKAPRPPKSWKGIKDASRFKPLCPQFNAIVKKYLAGSEDCLYLNVFTPKLDSDIDDNDTGTSIDLLPVIVFINGYIFQFDNFLDPHLTPDYLLIKDVVVVTFSQRYDVLGFLNLGTKEVPGNAGLKDQVAVLKWVKRNIEVFDGNPKSVTLLGHSSGAASAVLHTVSPMSEGLFHRVIALSGVPSLDIFYPIFVKEKSFLLGKLLNYDTTNTSMYLELLQRAPCKKLFNVHCTLFASEEITHVKIKKYTHFGPVIEEDFGQQRFLDMSPMKAFKLRKVHSVDIMFSYANMESLILAEEVKDMIKLYNRYIEMFVPSKILFTSTPSVILELGKKIKNYYFKGRDLTDNDVGAFFNYVSITGMVNEVHKYIRSWPKPAKTYLFQFSSFSSRNIAGVLGSYFGIVGAAHLDIINYIFNPEAFMQMGPLKEADKDYIMVEQLTKALTNFVKYGEPSPDCVLGVEWIQYDNKTQAWAEFRDDDIYVYDAHYEEDLAFWQEIYDSVKVDFVF